MGCISSSPDNVHNNNTTRNINTNNNNIPYAIHPQAIIICCYFNTKQSPYRLSNFNRFYASIRHMPHRIIECAIGEDTPFELNANECIQQVRTSSMLFHKEALLNKVIRELPTEYRYVFWVDGDILFTNKNWITASVAKMQQGMTVVQPFEYAIHMEKDMLTPSRELIAAKQRCMYLVKPASARRVWRSFAYNVENRTQQATDNDYDKHGHVGFAWGATREVLDAMGGLYERALVGGADHIMAHAIVDGGNLHSCIRKSHEDPVELAAITEWSTMFREYTRGRLGYVPGDALHLWHGDLQNRDYFHRIRKFSPMFKKITQKDSNGLFVTDDNDVKSFFDVYFDGREVDGTGNPIGGGGGSGGGGGGDDGDHCHHHHGDHHNHHHGGDSHHHHHHGGDSHHHNYDGGSNSGNGGDSSFYYT